MAARLKALSLIALAGLSGEAAAQFGMVQLPENDFVWTWGRTNGFETRTAREDFSVIGNEAGFRCELTGAMAIGRATDPTAMRTLENELQTSLFFIQESAQMMYQLDLYREIEWAMLDCKQPESTETEADLNEREQRAREKAEKRRERRRARED